MQHYWKKFLRKSLEEEIRDNRNRSNLLISRENGGKTPENEETEQTEENKKTEKRTATTVHLEIRELVKAGDLDAARTVLKQAVEDGYKGKRLDRWATVLLDDLGKVAKNKEEQFKKTKKKNKDKTEKDLTEEDRSGTIAQSTKNSTKQEKTESVKSKNERTGSRKASGEARATEKSGSGPQ